MSAVVVSPLPGAGLLKRFGARLRALFSRRLLLRLAGIEIVMLEGQCLPVRAVPLGVARELVPAIIRASRQFAEWRIDESLYDDMVKVLSLGLAVPASRIERLSVPLWELAPVVDRIARVNGLPVLEAGAPQMGELLAALMKSTGTVSSPGSSAQPAGPGTPSNGS